jgi:ferrous iron transport protein B
MASNVDNSALPILTDVKASPDVPRIALVGNPNAGKSLLFNSLSGARAKTANYPGVTVDLRKARVDVPATGDPLLTTRQVEIIDLPGTYSLEPLSPEEAVTVDCLNGRRGPTPNAVLVVLDGTNLSRNLYLASEVIELGLPTLVAVNMIDAARQQGIDIDAEQLAKRVDCPVVLVSAKTKFGLDDLRQQMSLLVADSKSEAKQRESCTFNCNGCTYAARHEWASSAGTASVRDAELVSQRSAAVRRRLAQLDRYLTSPIAGTLIFAAIMLCFFILVFALADWPMQLIDAVFGYLGSAVDAILPSVQLPMWLWSPLAFGVSMTVVAGAYRLGGYRWTRGWTAFAIGVSTIVAILPQEDFRSLLIDGVIGGLGGIVVFLPQICILFFFISLLEDSGYMARAAFVTERLMRRAGLPGKAFVPMLTSHACAIPGIMATRTIECWRDRLVTILVLPLLTCSARLPVYAMVAALLFAGQPLYAALVFAGAYLLGIVAALSMAFLLKHTLVPGEASPLVIELPPLRAPNFRNAFMTIYDRAGSFLTNAGTVILLISILLWGLATYPKLPESDLPRGQLASQRVSTPVLDATNPDALGIIDELGSADPMKGDLLIDAESLTAQRQLEYSFAGRIGKTFEPVFRPLGFDWKINVGVLSSFAAREVVVTTLAIVYGIGEDGAEDQSSLIETLRRQRHADQRPVFTTATCYSLLVFYVLAMQCLPTQVVTRRETGSWKWAILQLVYMTALAYVAALITYQTLAALGFA